MTASRTVLYAEDHPTSAELVRCVFALRPDLRLLVACSGNEALAIAGHEPLDLLLVDMQLGDMSGLDLARALAGAASPCRIPWVALTADAMPVSVLAAEEAGFAAYLTKPFDVQVLLRTVDRLLPGSSGQAAPG